MGAGSRQYLKDGPAYPGGKRGGVDGLREGGTQCSLRTFAVCGNDILTPETGQDSQMLWPCRKRSERSGCLTLHFHSLGMIDFVVMINRAVLSLLK